MRSGHPIEIHRERIKGTNIGPVFCEVLYQFRRTRRATMLVELANASCSYHGTYSQERGPLAM